MSKCQEFKQKRVELEKLYQEYGELFRDVSPINKGVLTFTKEKVEEMKERGKELGEKMENFAQEFKLPQWYWRKFIEGETALKQVLKVSQENIKEGQ